MLFTQVFFLIKYVVSEALPPSLMGLTLANSRSVLEVAGTGFVGHGGSFQLLTEATSVAPCYQNLAMKTQYNWFWAGLHMLYWPDFWFYCLRFSFIHGSLTEVEWVILLQVILCWFETVNTWEWKWMTCNLLLKLHQKMFWFQ